MVNEGDCNLHISLDSVLLRHRSSSDNICSAPSLQRSCKKTEKQTKRRYKVAYSTVVSGVGQCVCRSQPGVFPDGGVYPWNLSVLRFGRFCQRRRLRLISGLCGKPTLKLVHAGIGRHWLCGVLYAHGLSLRSSEHLILTRCGFTPLH